MPNRENLAMLNVVPENSVPKIRHRCDRVPDRTRRGVHFCNASFATEVLSSSSNAPTPYSL